MASHREPRGRPADMRFFRTSLLPVRPDGSPVFQNRQPAARRARQPFIVHLAMGRSGALRSAAGWQGRGLTCSSSVKAPS